MQPDYLFYLKLKPTFIYTGYLLLVKTLHLDITHNNIFVSTTYNCNALQQLTLLLNFCNEINRYPLLLLYKKLFRLLSHFRLSFSIICFVSVSYDVFIQLQYINIKSSNQMFEISLAVAS